MPLDARQTALSVLNQLDRGRQTLDQVWEQRLGLGSDRPETDKRDLALLYTLVYGVLRWRGRLDHIIAHFSNTPLRKIRPDILNILRLALFQIIFLDRIPDSAAVNCAVQQAKRGQAPWIGGYVNGVLRAAARANEQTPFPDTSKDPVKAVAARKAFPPWMLKRWRDQFGWDQTVALCDAINTIPPITARVNPLLTTRAQLMDALRSEARHVGSTPYSPHGVTCQNPRRPVAAIEAFRSGWFQVQDEAAQLASLFLNPLPGETVLDACCGLGGKTGHIAALMGDKGAVYAVDHNPSKLGKLTDEMARLQITIVKAHPHDFTQPWGYAAPPLRAMQFDRILLDAPCSGSGVLRRNPDAKWRAQPDWKRYQNRQLRFLENVASALKPGGILVYAVCSMEPEETEQVVDRFIQKRPEFKRATGFSGLTAEMRNLVNPRGDFRTFPHRHGMDGFFAARLKKSHI